MIKKNPAVDDSLEQSLIQLRGDMEAYREIMSLREDPRWKRVREIVKTNLNNADLALDGFKDLSDKGRDFYLKERIDMKWFMDIVDDAEYKIAELNRTIVDTQAKINERTKPRNLATTP